MARPDEVGDERPRAEGERSRAAAAFLIAALGVGLALRLALLAGRSLGYDELQSVTHAARGIPTGLLSALLHDPHPPLYYALLALWLHLGSSDAAVLSLSVGLSLLTVVSVHHVARVRWGLRVANAAALVFALDPLALHWSVHARMYALVMLLAPWAWHFAARLAAGSRRAADWLGAVAAELALLYSHVASPFFLAWILAAAAPDLVRHRDARRRWLGAQIAVAVGGLPYLYFPATTGQEHMLRPGPDELARALALFSCGVDPAPAWLVPLGAAAFAALALCGLRRAETRAFAAAFLVLPFAVAAAASHALRPIWLGPRLFAFVAPFFAIALARLLAGPPEAARGGLDRAVAAAALALVALGAVATARAPTAEPRYADAAAVLRAEGRPGDLVVVPTLKDKWALAWYATGPGWARGAVSGGFWQTLSRVSRGRERRALLAGLAGYGRDASGEPFGIVPADDLGRAQLASARRVWVVARSAHAADALRARLGSPLLRTPEAPGLAMLLLGATPAARADPDYPRN